MRHWNRLHPSLKVCKMRLDEALSSLGEWEVSLPMGGGWNPTSFSNPKHSMILWRKKRVVFSYCSVPASMEMGTLQPIFFSLA